MIDMVQNNHQILLLDNNLFRLFCKSPKQKAIKNFRLSTDNYPYFNRDGNYGFKLTPFALLEAIGIIPPKIYNIDLPPNIIENNCATSIADYLVTKSIDFYSNSPDLLGDKIISKAHEQRKYVQGESLEFYDKIIIETLDENGYREFLIKQLSMDYLMKYDYPNEIIDTMISFFGSQFFMNDVISNNISKFRLAKKLWSILYNKIQHNNKTPQNILATLKRAMEIDKHQDYLDCEIIHFACLGTSNNGEVLPVVSCSMDKPEIIIPRIVIYKSTIELFRMGLANSNPLHNDLPVINKSEGVFAFCQEDGSIFKSIAIQDVIELM